VAAHRLGFDCVGVPFGDASADEQLSRDVAGAVDVGSSSDRMVGYLRARTSFFDQVVVRAIDGGIGQIVIAAAGYHGRALRYGHSGVRWFELDHPDTQRDRQMRLDRLGIDVSHIRSVPADFTTDDVAGALRRAGLDPGAASLFTVEGVVAYLSRSLVASLFAAFRAVAAPGSLAAVSVSTAASDSGAPVARARFRREVWALGEPAAASLTVDEAPELFGANGWVVEAGEEAAEGSPADRCRRAGLMVLRPTEPSSGGC
jgi:methyltransferase (TIGR00027 family)